MEYKHHKDFLPSVRELRKRGGPYQKAAERVQSICGAKGLELDADPLVTEKMTNYGETRINKCWKYDLAGAARLITIRDNGIVLLCYVGDHDDCTKWLNRNKGMTLIRSDKGQIDYTNESSNIDDPIRLSGETSLIDGCLFEHISPDSYFDQLVEGIPRKVVRNLEGIESIHTEPEIYEIIKELGDVNQASTIYDVFVLLRQDKRKEAVDRIKLYLGEISPVSKLSDEQVAELADSQNIKTLKSDDPYYQQVFEYFVNNANYMDWMLFLHPDQQAIVDADYNGSTKLLGVSGSGKTCIVVQRAIALAKKYPEESVLVLTLNRQLAKLIEEMMDAACIPETRKQITVQPFFTFCQELLNKFEPENRKLYDDITWKSKEHIDEIWREYYRCELNNNDAEVLLPIHDSLISRSISAEKYIREEFDWIRSAVPSDNRNEYLDAERVGRSYPLDKSYRQKLLVGLELWEKKMKAVGVTDYLGLSTALYKYLDKIKPMYRCVLVDESQDFGTNEYRIIRKIVNDDENDLFFCGDAAQQVLTKHRIFSHAGINIPGARSLKIKKNYRNSREILKAAYRTLENNLSEELMNSADFEIIDPEYANFSGAAPLLLSANKLEQEISYGLAFIREEIADNQDRKACLAFCGYSLYQIQKFGERINLPVLDGATVIGSENIFLSDLEHTKGFEFDVMVIINCSESFFPDKTKPEREMFRDMVKFYVAMTRAKRQLVVSFSGVRSSLLRDAEEHFLEETWGAYVGNESIDLIGMPDSLEKIREYNGCDVSASILELDGKSFLYRKEAIGLEASMIERIRVCITGKSVIRSGQRVGWKSLADAGRDVDMSPVARREFGVKNVSTLRRLVGRIQFKST